MTKSKRPPRALVIAATLALLGNPPLAFCKERDNGLPGRVYDSTGLFATNEESSAIGEDFAEQLGVRNDAAAVLDGIMEMAGEQTRPRSSPIDAEESCSKHPTCQECISSSRFCHWCGHDNSCHAIGSRYGCLRGEKCHSKPDDGGKNGTTPEPSPVPTPKPTPKPSPPPPSPPPKNETGCASHSTCRECASSAWNCHWCRDQKCHAIGSIHGCLRSESCEPPPTPPPKKNDTGCASHKTCSECVLSSRFCNFCAHDNQCHAVGSIHGCVSSVNCYSNDRCTRKQPEPISRNVFGQIGMLPALAIVVAGIALLRFATACVSVVGCLSGAYEDLSAIAAEGRDDGRGYEPPEVDGSVMAQASEEVALMPPTSAGGDEECDGEGDNVANFKNGEDDAVGNVGNTEDEGTGEEDEGRPVHIEGDDNSEDEANARTPFLFWRSEERWHRHQPRPPSDVARFYKGCKVCYAVTVATVMFTVVASLICFPKAPDYNVCNDQVAWKSIVNGMTSGKIEASFQLLMSVENPNHMSVKVDMGSGTFKHDGVEVGTFEIPATTIGAMSITDVLVAVTFTPDKWQALALSTEYYKGTLKFAVDATATVVIPSLAGYTFSGGIENYIVHANDPKLQDRHLCACPQWKEEKKNDGPKFTSLLDFPA